MAALKRPESYSLKDLGNNWQKRKSERKKNIREIESKEKYGKNVNCDVAKGESSFSLDQIANWILEYFEFLQTCQTLSFYIFRINHHQ